MPSSVSVPFSALSTTEDTAALEAEDSAAAVETEDGAAEELLPPHLFYRVTYNAIKTVDEALQFAGPDFSIPNGFSWYQAFFDYCRTYELHPDFLTVHLYASNFNTSDRMIQNRYLADTTEHSYRSASGLYQSFFDFLHLVHQDPTFTDYPVIISDWNNTYHPKDYARDTCFMSSFIAS